MMMKKMIMTQMHGRAQVDDVDGCRHYGANGTDFQISLFQVVQIPAFGDTGVVKGALKMLDVKMTDVKLTDQMTGHKNAGH